MKRIEEYVNYIYRHVDGDRKEVKALKEEMRAHLADAVAELKEEGLGEEAAIDLALERFGEEKQLTGELAAAFRAQRIKKRLLYTSLALFLAGLATVVLFNLRDQPYRETYNLFWELMDKYEHKDNFTGADRRELQSLIEKEAALFENVSHLVIYRIPEETREASGHYQHYHDLYDMVFEHGRPGRTDQVGVDLFLEELSGEHMQLSHVGKHWFFDWGFKKYSYGSFYFLPYSLLVVSVLLFAVGGVMHGIHRRWFQAPRTANWLLYSSLVCLAAGLITAGIYVRYQAFYQDAHDLTEEIVHTCHERGEFSGEDYAALQSLLEKEAKIIGYLAVFKFPDEMASMPSYKYDPAKREAVFEYGERTFYDISTYGTYGGIPDGNWYIQYQFINAYNYYKYDYLPLAFFAAFAALLIAWRGVLFLYRKAPVCE